MVTFKHKVKLNLLGWLANPTFIFLISRQTKSRISIKFRQIVINYFLPKLLVTYGIQRVKNALYKYRASVLYVHMMEGWQQAWEKAPSLAPPLLWAALIVINTLKLHSFGCCMPAFFITFAPLWMGPALHALFARSLARFACQISCYDDSEREIERDVVTGVIVHFTMLKSLLGTRCGDVHVAGLRKVGLFPLFEATFKPLECISFRSHAHVRLLLSLPFEQVLNPPFGLATHVLWFRASEREREMERSCHRREYEFV